MSSRMKSSKKRLELSKEGVTKRRLKVQNWGMRLQWRLKRMQLGRKLNQTCSSVHRMHRLGPPEMTISTDFHWHFRAGQSTEMHSAFGIVWSHKNCTRMYTPYPSIYDMILVFSQVVFLHHIVSGCNLEEEAIKGLMYNDLDKSRFELHSPQQKRTIGCVHNHHT